MADRNNRIPRRRLVGALGFRLVVAQTVATGTVHIRPQYNPLSS